MKQYLISYRSIVKITAKDREFGVESSTNKELYGDLLLSIGDTTNIGIGNREYQLSIESLRERITEEVVKITGREVQETEGHELFDVRSEVLHTAILNIIKLPV